jgi:serine/threonine protein kinase
MSKETNNSNPEEKALSPRPAISLGYQANSRKDSQPGLETNSDSQPTAKLANFEPDLEGQIIAGHFQILSKLGEGGMSTVYRARHQLLKKEVAIKILHPHLVRNRSSRERFRQEAQAASQIEHANVVRIIDFGILENEQPYIVMDLLDGQSLGEFIKEKDYLSPEEALPIFNELLDALSFAHNKGIIHRDLKPSNVILTEKNGILSPKIVDFGIAKLLPHNETDAIALTQTGDVFGSPLYMSPEQCRGEKLDCRSDLYSLGCLMYECLTGHTPINGDNMLEILYRHLNEMPPSMKAVNKEADIPPKLEAIVFKALAKNPRDRQQTAQELADEINEFENSNTSSLLDKLVSPLLLYRSRRKRLNRQEKLALSLSLAAVLTLGLSSFTLGALYINGLDPPAQLDSLEFSLSFPEDRPKSFDLASNSTINELLAKLKTSAREMLNTPGKTEERLGDLQQYIETAQSCFNIGNYPKAVEAFQDCLKISRYENGNQSVITKEAAIGLLQSLYFNCDYQGIVNQFGPTMNEEIKIIDPHRGILASSMRIALGDSYYHLKSYSEARREFYEAKVMLEDMTLKRIAKLENKPRQLIALCYSRYAELLERDNLNSEALKFYKLAAPIWQISKGRQVSTYNLALCHYKEALLALKLGKEKEAEKAFKTAIEVMKPLTNDSRFRNSTICMNQGYSQELQKDNQWLLAARYTIEAAITKLKK